MTLVEFINKNHSSVGIAKLIFNFLGEKYNKVPLSEVSDTTSGGTPNRGISDYYGGNIPWLKSGEINDGLVTEYEETITEEGLKNSSAKLFAKGTLLVAMYGATAGKTGILGFDSTTNQALCAVYPKKGILRDYLFWYFRQARIDFLEISKGGAQPNISQTVIGRALIPFPEEEIQLNVVAFLNEIEQNNTINPDFIFPEIYDKINQLFSYRKSYSALQTELKTQATLLTQLRQAYLQEAVMGQLTAPTTDDANALLADIKAQKAQLIKEGKLRKEKPLPPIKPEEIPFEIPKNWVWCRLGEIVSMLGDGLHGTPNYTSDGNFFFINGNNLINGKIEIKENTKRVSEEEYLKHKKLLTLNTVFVSINGTLGNLAFYEGENVILGKSACYFNLFEEINKYYIGVYIKSLFFLKYAVDVASETTIKNVSLQSMRLLPLPLPPLSEQQAIVAKVEGLLEKVSALEAENKAQQAELERLMSAVLQEAFSSTVFQTVQEA